MKLYIFLSTLFLSLSLLCFGAYMTIGSYVREDGLLVEPFFLIPIGWLCFIVSLLLALTLVYKYLKRK